LRDEREEQQRTDREENKGMREKKIEDRESIWKYGGIGAQCPTTVHIWDLCPGVG
jgi:hypothetical protein